MGVIDKTQFKKYEVAGPLKVNDLKRYEREFLEDELRKKNVEH